MKLVHLYQNFIVLTVISLWTLFSPSLVGAQNTTPIVGGVGSVVKANLLINALLSKDYSTVTHLFRDEKALLYTPNENGITPIGLAIKNDDTFMLKYLLRQGVPLTSPYYTTPPLVLSMYSGSLDSLKTLLEGGADAQISYNNLTLLQLAIMLNRIDFCQLLLRYGAPIEQSADKGQLSPLTMALIKNNWDIAALIVQVSTNLNPQDRNGQTPLGFLISSRPSDIPKFLTLIGIRKSSVLNFSAKNSPPPLFQAIEKRDIKVAQTLLEAGANVNITLGRSRETPLMRAVKYEDENMVRLLLKYNAKVATKDRNGKTARSFAKEKENILYLLNQD